MTATKSSTGVLTALALAFSGALGPGSSVPAAATGAVAVATGVAALAFAPPAQARNATGPIELAPNAPDTYTVARGDTLWDISGKFLASPWRWPEVWNLNREQIHNPHLIYPGDLIVLDRSGPSPRLRIGKRVGGSGAGGNGGNQRLEPAVRASDLDASALPVVSLSAIQAFINRPLIITPKELQSAPRIVGTQEGRYYLGVGDKAYARGIVDDAQTEWQIYRPARALKDPDTGATIAWEALYLGSGNLVRKGDPATLQIRSVAEEIGPEDRLVATEPTQTASFAPHAPDQEIRGRIVSVYRGVSQVGRNNVVALNLGRQQGLEPGHVLTIESTGKVVPDFQTRESVRLPNENIGQLLVFRTFDAVSYALVVDATGPITVGDTVVTP